MATLINPTYEDYKNSQERALDYQEYRSTWDVLLAVGRYFHAVFQPNASELDVHVITYGLVTSSWHEDDGNGNERLHIHVTAGDCIIDNQPIIFFDDIEYIYDLPTNVQTYYVYIKYKYVAEYEPNIAEIAITLEPENSIEYTLIAKVIVDPALVDPNDPNSGITVDLTPRDQLMNFGTPLAFSIAGGDANQILYQTGPNTTGFIDAPPNSSNLFLHWDEVAQQFIWSQPTGGDADLLDGLDSSQFLRSDVDDTAQGVITFEQPVLLPGSGTAINFDGITDANPVLFQNNNTNDSILEIAKLSANDSDYELRMYYGGVAYKVWHEGNDGSGSGLDADLLDGIDSTQFARTDIDETFDGNVTIQGDLIVNGTQTIVNTTDLAIEDNEIILNNGETGAGVTEGYAGIRVDRGSEIDARLIYDETEDRWMIDNGDGNLYYITYSTDGNGSGVNADTLDGIDSSQFLRSDIDDIAEGNIRFLKGIVNYPSSGNTVHVVSPGGAHLRLGGAGLTGAIKITLPIGYENVFMSFDVTIFDYAGGSDGESIKMTIGGYAYSGYSRWYNYFARTQSNRTDRFFNVRFGDDGNGHACIWIGETDSTWDYLTVSISNVVATGNNYSAMQDGWSVALVTSFDNVTNGPIQSELVSSYALNSNALDGLDSGQFIRSDVDDSWTGILTYNRNDGVAFRFDSDFGYAKWISINDGAGNFNIAANWDGSNKYITDGGATRIALMQDGTNGYIWMRAADQGNAGDSITGYSEFIFTSSYFRTSEPIQIIDSNTQLSRGVNNSLRITTSYGYGDIGPQSTSYFHFRTDRSRYDFEKPINVLGDSNRIYLQPATSGGYTGIRFDSRVNAGSDYGYIYWYDDNNTYNYWGDSSENGALVIGVQNDGRTITSDVVALKSPASIIFDAPETRWRGAVSNQTDNSTFTIADVIYGQALVRHAPTNLATGWYTIATNTGDRAIGDFILIDVASGRHQSIRFIATHMYGTDTSNNINVLMNARHGGSPIRRIRIKDGGTYDGAVLQVYIEDPTNDVSVYLLNNHNYNGWVLKDWIPDSTDPGDVDNYSSMTPKIDIDIDWTDQGGMMISNRLTVGARGSVNGEIYINDYNTRILEGGANSIRLQTNSGYVDIGPQNTTWCNFATDRPSYHFNKDIYTWRYNGSNYAIVQAFAHRYISSNVTAISWDYLLVDTSGGEIQVTLPASPTNFDKIYFLDVKGTFDQNRLLIRRNGKNIMGLAEDMEVTSKNISFGLIYYNGDWRIVNE